MKFAILLSLILLLGIGTSIPCSALKITITTDQNFIDGRVHPYSTLMPGDTLEIAPGLRSYLLFRDFYGTNQRPIIITNGGGVVEINTSHYYGISIQSCNFLRLTGSGDPGSFYGIKITYVQNGTGIGVGYSSSDIEIDHVSIENTYIAGIYAKTDPDCSFTTTRGNFTQYNTHIHDNYIANTGDEGLYIGSTKYFGQLFTCDGHDTLLLPSLLDGVRVYNNIVQNTGWDGIQVSSASKNCKVYNNIVLHDSQREVYSQMSGIILGGGSNCDCYNNYIKDGKGNGIENHGLGGNKIFNNIIVDAGRSFFPSDSSKLRQGIFVSDISMLPDSSIYIIHNTIVNPKSEGIRFFSIVGKNNLIAANLIVNPGNFDWYENGNTSFKGIDSYIMIPNDSSEILLTGNYLARSFDNTGCSEQTYALQSDSPLVDMVQLFIPGTQFDYYNQDRPYGSGADVGAIEYSPENLSIFEEDNTPLNNFSFYPNPAKEKLYIVFTTEQNKDLYFAIYSMNGTRLLADKVPVSNDNQKFLAIDVKPLKAGLYIFELKSGNEVVTGKFIKN